MIRTERIGRIMSLVLLMFASLLFGTAVHRACATSDIGSTAPDFSLETVSGKTVSLTDYSGHPTVLFFLCGCKVCDATSKLWLNVIQNNPSVREHSSTVIVFAGSTSSEKKFEERTGISESTCTILLDPQAYVSTVLFDSDPCPCAYVLTANQTIVFSYDHAKSKEQPAVANELVSQVLHSLALLPKPRKNIASDNPKADTDIHLEPLATNGTTVSLDQGFTEAKYDFGTVDRSKSKTVSHVFELKNDTSSVISIYGIQPSCGCTTAFINDSQSFPVDVKPGATVEATAYVDLSDLYAGDVEKSIYVFGKPGSSALAYLELDGQIQSGT